MATVYSLVCWGGSAGKSVTASSTTDLVTLTNHGLKNATGVQFTSGTLPTVAGTALAVNTTYYAKSISSGTFELYYDAALTSKIDFTSNGSSLILKGAYYRSIADYSRWGGATGRIFASLRDYISTRITLALGDDVETVEIGEAFDDIGTLGVSTASATASAIIITSVVNGTRSAAYHNGIPGSAYRFIATVADNACVNINSYGVTIDGLEFCTDTATNGTTGILVQGSTGFNGAVSNCIFRALGAGQQPGAVLNQNIRFFNNVCMNFAGTTYGGIYSSNGLGVTCYNNLVTKCGIGFKSNSSQGLFYNNLSVGNTLNYSSSPQTFAFRAFGNIGQTTDKYTVTATSGTTTMTWTPPTGGPMQIGSAVSFSTTGSLPEVGGVPLDASKVYFVKSFSGSTFTIAATYGGSTLTFSSAGTGTHSVSLVWSSAYAPTHIDFSTPNDVFKDWTNNDFRPAGTGATPNAKALQVDTYVDIFGITLSSDIADKERPNYNNGGAEYRDVGPFEYDRGYGPRPASTSVTFQGVVAGSEIHVYDAADNEIAGVESCTANHVLSWSIPANPNVKVTIIKRGLRWMKFPYASQEGNQSIPIFQSTDLGYNNPP